jgi:hypothetical protein
MDLTQWTLEIYDRAGMQVWKRAYMTDCLRLIAAARDTFQVTEIRLKVEPSTIPPGWDRV